ncbi:sulfatase-like hydrolase/transferase [Akkermansiaceae bacterium]|nr:sulfatase-like hydrolase/transferase [Akkermansiaceae bacterium]
MSYSQAIKIAKHLTVTTLLTSLSLSSDLSANDRPNVVVIVIDDLGYADISCMENAAKDVETPSIDDLAAHGVLFPQGYTSAPICNASRVGIMTGAYQQRQNVYWYGGEGLSNGKYGTIAESLKENGYKTGYIGKFHHGSTDNVDGRGFPLNHGFDTFFGFSGGTKHYLKHDVKYVPQNGVNLMYNGPFWNQKEHENVEGFSTEVFGEKARQFLHAHQEDSFYLHLSFNGVHNFTHQLPDTYLKEKGLNKFPDFDPKKEDYWKWREMLGYPSCAQGRDYYLGQLHYLDTEIGKVVDEINNLGIRDNTVIFLISDNGGSLITYANNTPLHGGKYTLFEGGVRTPLIVSLPSVLPENKIDHSIVSTLDLLPTICDITNTATPQHVDGISILPFIQSPEKDSPERSLFWQTKDEKSVRKGKWKLLITSKNPNKRLQVTPTPKGTFLFDLEADIGETTNLATKYPKVVKELALAHKNWSKTMKDSQ